MQEGGEKGNPVEFDAGAQVEVAVEEATESVMTPLVAEEEAAHEAHGMPFSAPPATRPGLIERDETQDTMASLLEEEDYSYRQPERGDILRGTVVSIESDGIIVDVGLKREGIVPKNDLERLDKEMVGEIHEGDEIDVYVMRPRDRDGNLLLSIQRARSEGDWTKAQELMDSSEVWEGKVTAANEGGLVVPFGKIRGFLPASQVVGIPRKLTDDAKTNRLGELVNQTLPLKIIEVDRRRRRLIFSHRAAWWKWKEQKRGQLLNDLKEGDTCRGVVSSLRDFGAFVDLGGADGLIHVSELSWQRVKHPGEVLKVGDEVEAYVLNVDKDRKRIGLSLKRLQPEPWSEVEERYEIGQLVEGVVTRVVEFGAFVKIDDGVEGLVHKSELADVVPQKPSDLVKEGDLLLLRVIRIDGKRRRIGLSLRQVTEEEWADWAAKFRSSEPATEGSAEASAPADEASDAEAAFEDDFEAPEAAAEEFEDEFEAPEASEDFESNEE